MPTFRRNFLILLPLALLTASLLFQGGADAEPKAEKTSAPQLEPIELGITRNVHQFGPTLLCGQPDKAAFEKAQQEGIKVVVTLRKENEINWDESKLVQDLGMEFHQLGFQSPDSLSDEILDKSRDLLRNSDKSPVMLHCGSANRVGAVWMAYRVLDEGIDPQTALKEAQQVGLRTPAYAAGVMDYIKRKEKMADTTGMAD
ncbi:MAG: hypothetical protein KDA65_08645 [Planctomycetaceae bacterium]|nr:hypothetical protein [Planctomycetaceae bacterium]